MKQPIAVIVDSELASVEFRRRIRRLHVLHRAKGKINRIRLSEPRQTGHSVRALRVVGICSELGDKYGFGSDISMSKPWAKPDNGSDHRVRTIILQAEKTARKPDFACIALLSAAFV